MAGAIKFNYDKSKLDRIVKFFDSKKEVKIGVLSNEWKQAPDKKWERKIGPVELAMVHEFGSTIRRIPQRSFLRKTMVLRSGDFKSEIEANRSAIMDNIANGQGYQFLAKVGATWRAYVLEAWNRSGPGWAPLSQRTIDMRRSVWTGKYLADNGKKRRREYAKSTKILWVTGALARSISFEVTKG